MSQLGDFLQWPEEGELADRYEDRFRLAAERRLSTALSAAHGHSMEVAGSIVRTAAAIPSESLLRLAHAPELEFRLRGLSMAENGRDGLTAFLCEGLQAELLLLDTRVGAPGGDGVWTGLGDVHFDVDATRREEAPALGESIRVDFDSPYNRGDVGNRFPSYAVPPGDERTTAVAALREAHALVESASPSARRFTEAFTRIVVCIGIPGDQYGSFSSHWYPGRSVLINVDRMDAEELAAALVHEAIHSLVDASELGGQLLTRPAPGTTVASPWSGASLALQSLLEAYFVWYGLLWFWRRAGESGTVDARAAERRVDEARRGFEPPFDRVLGDARPAVHEATADAIERLRLEVLATVE